MSSAGENLRGGDIAIVGMGCRYPGAPNLSRFWSLLKSGAVEARAIPKDRWRHESFYDANPRRFDKTYANKLASIENVNEFAPEFFGILPRRARLMDPQQRLFLDVARSALEDAGYGRSCPERNTGVYLGISVSEHHQLAGLPLLAKQIQDGDFGRVPPGLEEAWNFMLEDAAPVQGYSMIGQMLNMAAANVSQSFDLQGPSFATDAACSSSLVALGEAVLHLRGGLCDAALVGGVYLALKPDNLVSFSRIGALSLANQCRPFDEKADGFVLGEGAGAVVLKRLEDAKRDGDSIRAVVKGFSINADGRGEGPMTPRKEGQLRVLRRAYEDADVCPGSIQYFEAHGTGTRVGDATEAASICELLAERGVSKTNARLGAVKANIGHTIAAAGVAGVIKTALAMEHGVIPPLAGFESARELGLADAGISIPTELEAWPDKEGAPRRASVSSFGFGGTNVHAILEEGQGGGRKPLSRSQVQVNVPSSMAPISHLIMLSAPTSPELHEYARELVFAVQTHDLALEDVAYTLARRDHKGATRAAFVVQSKEELLKKLSALAAGLHEGVLVSSEEKSADDEKKGLLTFLFPGQGAQTINQCRALYESYPAFRNEFDRLAAIVDPKIAQALFPPLGQSGSEEELRRTEICQPAMALLELSLLALVESLGIVPDLLLGHSLGEFLAATAGGAIEKEKALQFIATRGKQMAGLPLADNGTMLAVAADSDSVAKGIEGISGVSVANINHPRQTVISGETSSVLEAEEAFKQLDIPTSRLSVSHAFHSEKMAPIDEWAAKYLLSTELRAPSRTVISAVEPGSYPTSVGDIKALWSRHATSKIQFSAGVQTCIDLGATEFVQMAGGRRLATMASRVILSAGLSNSDVLTTSFDSGKNEGVEDFLSTIGELFVRGRSVHTESLVAEGCVVSLPPTPLATRPFWILRPPSRPADLPHFGGGVVQGAAPVDFEARLDRIANEISSLRESYRGVSPDAVTVADSAPKPEVNAPLRIAPVLTPDMFEVKDTVVACLSKVTAIPESDINLNSHLVADLGFDSLMAVEFTASLSDAMPHLGALPASMLTNDISIKALIKRLEEAATQARPDSVEEKSEQELVDSSLQTFVPRWKPNGLTTSSTLFPNTSFEGGVLLVTPGGVAAKRIQLEFEHAGVDVLVVPPEARPNGEAKDVGLVVDAQFLDGEPLNGAVTDSMDWARRAAHYEAGYVLVRRSGGVRGGTGFVRSLAKEWHGRVVKSLEFSKNLDADSLGRALVREIFSTDTTVETLWTEEGRFVQELVPLDAISNPLPLGARVVIAGGSAGLGAMLAKHVARNYSARLLLLGQRSSEQVAELLSTIGELGGSAMYEVCDVVDEAAVRVAVQKFKGKYGPVQYVVHAAGVGHDELFESAAQKKIQAVLDTKIDGAHSLWNATKGAELAGFAMYSSWAGRFGNSHQTAYAAGNRALSDTATLFQIEAPQTRVVALELPPWEGGGMVDRLAEPVKKQLKAAVPFLKDDEALPRVISELAARSDRPNAVLLGNSVPSEPLTDVAVFEISGDSPFLCDHKIGGVPVLPMALAVDLALSAGKRLGGAGPGSSLALRGFEVLRGVILHNGHGVLRVSAEHVASGRISVKIEFAESRRSSFSVAYRGQLESLTTAPEGLHAPEKGTVPNLPVREFYEKYSFHGPTLRGVDGVAKIAPSFVLGSVRASETDSLRGELVDVLALDSAFQLCGYWARTQKQKYALPRKIGACLIERIPAKGSRLTCLATLVSVTDESLLGHIEVSDENGRIAVLRDIEADFFANLDGGEVDSEVEQAEAEIALDTSTFTIAEFPEVKELGSRIQMADAFGIKNPYFNVQEEVRKETSTIEGVEYINFASYNYLGLSGEPDINERTVAAVEKFGTSVSASRVASGERPIHRELELTIADFLGCEDSIVMVGGHSTNVSVIGHVVGPEDVIVHDSLAHDSILGGAKLSGARRRPFAHNDLGALETVLKQVRPNARRVLIAVEGVYSMDGDVASLPEIIELKKKYGALLFVDEAHSLGVLGKTGRGIGEHFDVVRSDVDMWMGTLSKSLASCGGYIAGSKQLIEFLKYTNPGFIYSVGISPANAAAAIAAVEKLKEEPNRVDDLRDRAELLTSLFEKYGIDVGLAEGTGVVPCIVGSSLDSLKLAEKLRECKINVQPIMYPAVEEDLARLRFFVTSSHTEEQIRQTAKLVRDKLLEINPKHLDRKKTQATKWDQQPSQVQTRQGGAL